MLSYSRLLKNKSYKLFNKWFNLLAIFIPGLIFSCGDIPTCLPTETNLVKIAFVDESGKAKQTTLSLRVIDYEDLFLNYSDTTLSKIEIPLNPASNTTTLVIGHDNVSDTLGLTYSVVRKLISPECGLEIGLNDLDTTFSTFEKVEIIERIIFEDVNTNIEITI